MSRGRGEGSLRKRADDRWEGRYWTREGRQRSVFGRTRTEASRKLRAALEGAERGLEPGVSSGPLAQYLPAWLEAARPSLKQQAASSYERAIRLHLVPQLGRTRVERLTPLQVQQLYARLLKAGYSPKTVRNIHGVLHRALEKAVQWGVVPVNVSSLVDLPRLSQPEMRVFTQEEVRRIVDSTQGDALEALWLLALTVGLRAGELLALRWEDVDLRAGTVSVSASVERETGARVDPKTRSGRRRIKLSPSLMAALTQHRRAQGTVLGWAYVFPASDGQPLSQPALWRRWRKVTDLAGVRPLRFHDCRHTAATHMLARGVDVKTVSAILGHAKASITLNLYAHVLEETQERAVRAVEDLLSGEFVGQFVGQNGGSEPISY